MYTAVYTRSLIKIPFLVYVFHFILFIFFFHSNIYAVEHIGSKKPDTSSLYVIYIAKAHDHSFVYVYRDTVYTGAPVPHRTASSNVLYVSQNGFSYIWQNDTQENQFRFFRLCAAAKTRIVHILLCAVLYYHIILLSLYTIVVSKHLYLHLHTSHVYNTMNIFTTENVCMAER